MTNPFQHEKRKNFTPQERAQVFVRRHGKCHRCERVLLPRDRWILEHVIALENGGMRREDLITLVRREYGQGRYSANEIAQMAGVTKNTVIGLHHRMNEEEKMKNSHMTRAQEFAVAKQLEDILTKATDGYFDYAEGWDDERVAEQHGVSRTNVVNLRKSIFGSLRVGRTLIPLATVIKKLTELEQRVADLERGKRVSEYVSSSNGSVRATE